MTTPRSADAGDKDALIRSPAGMRLIAELTIYNRGDWPRLKQFIRESYHPDLLTARPAAVRIAERRGVHASEGRLRVAQTVATAEHHVVALLASEHGGGLWLADIEVEADYPHRIISTEIVRLPA